MERHDVVFDERTSPDDRGSRSSGFHFQHQHLRGSCFGRVSDALMGIFMGRTEAERPYSNGVSSPRRTENVGFQFHSLRQLTYVGLIAGGGRATDQGEEPEVASNRDLIPIAQETGEPIDVAWRANGFFGSAAFLHIRSRVLSFRLAVMSGIFFAVDRCQMRRISIEIRSPEHRPKEKPR
jgi:hypothetical protein